MSGICNNGAGFACIKESMEEMIKTNKEIEEEIRIEKKKMKNRIKILLLGCGEAGKSTFIKQMRIIHAEKNQSPWTDEQLKQYRSDVLRNCIQCIQILLNQNNEDLPVGYQNNASKLMELLAENPKDQDRLFQHSVFIQELWQEESIQEVYRRRREFDLPDCCAYFLDNIQRVTSQDYLPTDQDILQIRVMTTGVVEYAFKTSSKEIIMIDVGGQRSERKKWIHCFEDVLLLMFLCAASEYDQVLLEDHTQNRMVESINLFKVLITESWFRTTSIALFLNKIDLLEKKIQVSSLQDYFPEFRDFEQYKDRDFKSAIAFIRDKFLNFKNPDGSFGIDTRTRTVFVHNTCATDTENVRKVFKDVKTTILEKNVREML